MNGRLYVRCPRCEAEEPWRAERDASPAEGGTADDASVDRTSQQCSVCGIVVLVSEATTFHRS